MILRILSSGIASLTGSALLVFSVSRIFASNLSSCSAVFSSCGVSTLQHYFTDHSLICKANMSSIKGKCGHIKALTSPYPSSDIKRTSVPEDKISWSVPWPDYSPVEYTAPSVLKGPVWADPPIGSPDFTPRYNEKDGKVERQSHNGKYDVVDGYPRNPVGRTGLKGRGLLGRWGPNHAADPIVTRWKRDRSGNIIIHPESEKPILQFISIKRLDCGEWAIPGGMVDPGEKLSVTLKREFGEEALNLLQKSESEKKKLQDKLEKIFKKENFVVYGGYVDDPRNTDNAWMETVAVNYHDETGETLDHLTLEAGDDAGKVKWVDMSDTLKLYASHVDFVKLVAEKHNALWSGKNPSDVESGQKH